MTALLLPLSSLLVIDRRTTGPRARAATLLFPDDLRAGHDTSLPERVTALSSSNESHYFVLARSDDDEDDLRRSAHSNISRLTYTVALECLLVCEFFPRMFVGGILRAGKVSSLWCNVGEKTSAHECARGEKHEFRRFSNELGRDSGPLWLSSSCAREVRHGIADARFFRYCVV